MCSLSLHMKNSSIARKVPDYVETGLHSCILTYTLEQAKHHLVGLRRTDHHTMDTYH